MASPGIWTRHLPTLPLQSPPGIQESFRVPPADHGAGVIVPPSWQNALNFGRTVPTSAMICSLDRGRQKEPDAESNQAAKQRTLSSRQPHLLRPKDSDVRVDYQLGDARRVITRGVPDQAQAQAGSFLPDYATRAGEYRGHGTQDPS